MKIEKYVCKYADELASLTAIPGPNRWAGFVRRCCASCKRLAIGSSMMSLAYTTLFVCCIPVARLHQPPSPILGPNAPETMPSSLAPLLPFFPITSHLPRSPGRHVVSSPALVNPLISARSPSSICTEFRVLHRDGFLSGFRREAVSICPTQLRKRCN
jgi:hypothetical protein